MLDFDILCPQPQLPLVIGRVSTCEDMFLCDWANHNEGLRTCSLYREQPIPACATASLVHKERRTVMEGASKKDVAEIPPFYNTTTKMRLLCQRTHFRRLRFIYNTYMLPSCTVTEDLVAEKTCFQIKKKTGNFSANLLTQLVAYGWRCEKVSGPGHLCYKDGGVPLCQKSLMAINGEWRAVWESECWLHAQKTNNQSTSSLVYNCKATGKGWRSDCPAPIAYLDTPYAICKSILEINGENIRVHAPKVHELSPTKMPSTAEHFRHGPKLLAPQKELGTVWLAAKPLQSLATPHWVKLVWKKKELRTVWLAAKPLQSLATPHWVKLVWKKKELRTVWLAAKPLQSLATPHWVKLVWKKKGNIYTLKRSSAEMQERGKRESLEKTRRPVASSDTTPTCENLGVTQTRPLIEPVCLGGRRAV
ncbi:hypothetical protein PR048_007165 [Dryococelus australis]|uniref:Uncharacterized protein n=1 Tax=Dryococelus australis TaxID=614101 RepID=A0ABQ9ID09_9NEOP|nr:hypothetical protein PR048_007165 [Dryococelus australis]